MTESLQHKTGLIIDEEANVFVVDNEGNVDPFPFPSDEDSGGSGIDFNIDNEGGWLYAASHAHLVLGTDVPAMDNEFTITNRLGSWGQVLSDKTGYGILIASDTPVIPGHDHGVAFQATSPSWSDQPAAVSWMNLASDFMEVIMDRDDGHSGYFWLDSTFFQIYSRVEPHLGGYTFYIDHSNFSVSTQGSSIDMDDSGNGAFTVGGTTYITLRGNNIYIRGTYEEGYVIMDELPTSDPSVFGALWVDSATGTLKVSGY